MGKEMSTPEIDLSYYQTLSDLRGQTIGALMTGNHAFAGVLLRQIDNLTAGDVGAQGTIITNDQKKNLRDALAKMNRAIESIFD